MARELSFEDRMKLGELPIGGSPMPAFSQYGKRKGSPSLEWHDRHDGGRKLTKSPLSRLFAKSVKQTVIHG